MRMSKRWLYLLPLLCWQGTFACHAQDYERPLEHGFSGYVEVLGAYFGTNSQFNTDRDNRRISSLDRSGEWVNDVRPLPLFLVNYTFAADRTRLYAGVQPENMARGQYQVEIGIRHWLQGGTLLSAAVIPVTPIAAQTWEDPFVLEARRRRTDADSWGISLAADRIAGSGIGLGYEFARTDVENENSGRFLLSRPGTELTIADVDDLRRDADVHRVSLDYRRSVSGYFKLKPGVGYTYSRAEGSAMRFHGLQPELTLGYFRGRLSASLNLSYRIADYSDKHPVFGKRRRDHRAGVIFAIGYRRPFGLKNFRIDWFNAAMRTESNIAFYETTALISAVGVGYEF
jgi:hypothetical protein